MSSGHGLTTITPSSSSSRSSSHSTRVVGGGDGRRDGLVPGLPEGLVLGLLGVVTGNRLLRGGFAAPAGYLAVVVAGTVTAPAGTSLAARARLPLVLAATHLSWGLGFLVGLRGRSSAGR